MNKREIFDVVHEYKKLKDRINKAIEYIKQDYEINKYSKSYLLEILKGDTNV